MMHAQGKQMQGRTDGDDTTPGRGQMNARGRMNGTGAMQGRGQMNCAAGAEGATLQEAVPSGPMCRRSASGSAADGSGQVEQQGAPPASADCSCECPMREHSAGSR
jgi:hypothetical protein